MSSPVTRSTAMRYRTGDDLSSSEPCHHVDSHLIRRELLDWGTHLGVGMEYDRWNVGDGGFIARFSDGTETGAAWKCRAYYISPLPAAGAVTEAFVRDHRAI